MAIAAAVIIIGHQWFVWWFILVGVAVAVTVWSLLDR